MRKYENEVILMNCPSVDKLSQYVDELLEPKEHQALKLHINTCEQCQHIIQIFEDETHFIKETLQTPALPNDFDEQILAQLKPYKQKQSYWKRPITMVASAVLAIGLLATVTPTVAEYVKSIFSSEEVDYGIQEAERLGFVEEVDYEATSNGITLHIDEIMVDTKRIAFVVRATNKRGKAISPLNFGEWDKSLELTFTKSNGEPINDFLFGTGFLGRESYAIVQVDTPKLSEDLIMHWKVDEVTGKKGDWQFEIPIPIEKALPHLKMVDLQQTISIRGNEIFLEQMAFTPSSATLNYRIKQLQSLPVDDRLNPSFGINIAYTITDDQEELITSNHLYYQEIEEVGMPPLTAEGGSETIGEWQWEAVFSTITAPKPTLNIVGIEQVTYINEDVTFIPNQLDENAVLYVEGYPVQITAMEQQSKGEPRTEITLNDVDELPFYLEQWYLVDETGTDYLINRREGNKLIISKEMDFNQNYTLTLLTTRKLEQLENPIHIPLHN